MIAGLGIVCKRRLPGFMHETILFEPSTGIMCRRVMSGEKDSQEVVCCSVSILIKCRGASECSGRCLVNSPAICGQQPILNHMALSAMKKFGRQFRSSTKFGKV